MRDRVNVPIDDKIKRMFEDLKDIHGKTWTEALEEKAMEIIMDVDPVKVLEYQIKVEEEKQEERRQVLIRTKTTIATLGSQKNIDEERIERELQLNKEREGTFEKEFAILERQWRDGSINWVRILDLGKFKDKDEAKKWLEGALKARGLMGKYFHYR